jgi:hypothetical protein
VNNRTWGSAGESIILSKVWKYKGWSFGVHADRTLQLVGFVVSKECQAVIRRHLCGNDITRSPGCLPVRFDPVIW